jgi:F-box interacting protein
MRSKKMFGENDPYYVFALGCNQLQPRCSGCPPELAGFFDAPVLVSGNLHWSWWPYPVKKNQSGKMITVFDTTAESFHLMSTPIMEARRAYLYEVDDTLGIYSCNDTMTAVHIWVMQDYDSEVWSHKYHVKLPVAEIRVHESRDVVWLSTSRGMCLSSTILDQRCYLHIASSKALFDITSFRHRRMPL